MHRHTVANTTLAFVLTIMFLGNVDSNGRGWLLEIALKAVE
jgi:hypothetical protein